MQAQDALYRLFWTFLAGLLPVLTSYVHLRIRFKLELGLPGVPMLHSIWLEWFHPIEN